MPVSPVVRVDGIVVGELAAHADRNRLLTDAQVHEAVHLVRASQLSDALLEHADPPHAAKELDAEAGVELLRRHCVHAQAATGEEPTACCTAATILSSLGMRYSSIGWL